MVNAIRGIRVSSHLKIHITLVTRTQKVLDMNKRISIIKTLLLVGVSVCITNAVLAMAVGVGWETHGLLGMMACIVHLYMPMVECDDHNENKTPVSHVLVYNELFGE